MSEGESIFDAVGASSASEDAERTFIVSIHPVVVSWEGVDSVARDVLPGPDGLIVSHSSIWYSFGSSRVTALWVSSDKACVVVWGRDSAIESSCSLYVTV